MGITNPTGPPTIIDLATALQGTQHVAVSTPVVNPGLKPIIDSLPSLAAKKAPTQLAEYVNSNTQEVGAVIYVLEEDSKVKNVTNEFYLSSLQITLKERVQVLEAFNSSHVSFFDQAVRVYQISGAAVDHESQDSENRYEYFHQSSLIHMYTTVLRGSRLLENNSIGVLKVKNHLIYGYPINLNVSYTSAVDKIAQFTMQWVVTDHKLDASGTVTERQLEELHSYTRTLPSAPYIDEIDDFLEAIDKILLLKNWVSSANSDVEELVTLLGVSSFIALTHGYISGLSAIYKKALVDYLGGAVSTFYSIYKEKLSRNDNIKGTSYLTPLLKQWGVDKQEALTTAINRMAEVANEGYFSEFQQFTQDLTIFKNELLVFKARLLY